MTATPVLPTEATKKPPHEMRVKMCAQVKADFKQWCQTRGFGTGGMTRAIATAIKQRSEVRLYAEFSYPRREKESTLAISLDPELFRDFNGWCDYQCVSMSSVIRGWIDHREAIAPYIVPRTDSLEAELHKAQQVLQDVERIYR